MLETLPKLSVTLVPPHPLLLHTEPFRCPELEECIQELMKRPVDLFPLPIRSTFHDAPEPTIALHDSDDEEFMARLMGACGSVCTSMRPSVCVCACVCVCVCV